MKTINLKTFVLSLIVVLLTSINFAYAQAPQKFSYQAVVRDGNGELATNQNIGMQISILEDSENGSAVYVERHFPTTNANGLVSIEIGTGTVISGNFEDIVWGTNTYYIQNETDINGGSNYDITGTSQLLSVPYALYAENSGDGIQDGSNEGNTLFWDGNDWVTSSAFLYNDGNRVGIDTTNPEASLHVAGEDGFLVTGEFGQGANLATSGAGTKLFFYPKKAAFRAGYVSGPHWDDNSIGVGSTAWGANTEASGAESTAWGGNTIATGLRSTAWGINTEASGVESTAWGLNAKASGDESTAWGHNTEALGSRSTAWGFNTEASGSRSTAWGVSTEASGSMSTAWGFATEALGLRSTAWGFGTEASGEMSTAWGENTEASGLRSTTWGQNTKASGLRSTAWGQNTEALGAMSTAWGYNTEASGAESTAWGSDTEASGFRSTAWGFATKALGARSTAWGHNTEASGVSSTAWGWNTEAKSGYETALGRFNTDYTPMSSTAWNLNDRLFVIGNGTSTSNRSDAMVILKNGNTGIGISDPEHKLAVEVTNNTTPNGDGIGIVNTESNSYWNIHMSSAFLRFSLNNNNVSYLSNTGAYVQSSDKRLKENIIPLEDGVLQKVNNINTVFYNYKNDENKVKTIGVIAQELKLLFPEFVFQDENSEYMGVDYAGLSVVAIKALQEQQSEIEELKAKNQALEQKINQILEQLNN